MSRMINTYASFKEGIRSFLFFSSLVMSSRGLDALEYNAKDPITDKERELIMAGLSLEYLNV